MPLLEVGVTDLDEATLTFGEREFIKAMVDAKLAEYVIDAEAPAAPVSETKLVGPATDIAGADEAIPKHAAARGKKKGRGR